METLLTVESKQEEVGPIPPSPPITRMAATKVRLSREELLVEGKIVKSNSSSLMTL